ncbi:putative phage abortive infection protein [Niallia taxi]|uniref:putative phage abortive infection protein n=1 Tax=Niallia taxi TaxID=2499688 RepID=UPI001F36EF4E|nr:putative phage abortive infection protein [Niallia taxi]
MLLVVLVILIVLLVLKTNLRNKISDIGILVFTILGFALLVTASIMPFAVKNYYDSRLDKYDNLTDIGAVGDFIGGTTVAFLTASSVVLLLATIIMQRKEIKISQQSIVELVKQTEASVKQAEEARKETQITNETMKKQQFETTFFNMVNLHHNILKEIQIEEFSGRAAIEYFYDDLINTYDGKIYREYCGKLKEEALEGDIEILDGLIKQFYLNNQLSEYIDEFEQHFLPMYDENGIADMTELEEFYETVDNGQNTEWNRRKEQHLVYYSQNIYGDYIAYSEIIEEIDFNSAKDKFSNVYIDKFKTNFHNQPMKDLKKLAYEEVYKRNENAVGHYYRNLYRIVKFIQSETFDVDDKTNEIEKRKYRGILRAQLSSFELLMVFYNVVYSQKGEKFKEILINTNFFDDHLVTNDFIWKNDIEEVASLDTTNTENK